MRVRVRGGGGEGEGEGERVRVADNLQRRGGAELKLLNGSDGLLHHRRESVQQHHLVKSEGEGG